MARTALTPYQLVRDAGVAVSTGAVDATNGNIVAVPGPFRARIVVQNSDASSHTLVVRGGGYTGAANGAANSGLPAPANVVFTASTKGDLSVPVAAGTIQVVTINETDRFVQADGSMWLDWSAATGMSVYVLIDPYVNPS